jgi:hypothetical protein
VTLREAINDTRGAETSRANLGFVLAPVEVADEPRDPLPFSDVTAADAFALSGASPLGVASPLGGANWSAAHTPARNRSGRTALLALQMLIVAGLGFFVTLAAFEGSWDLARLRSLFHAASAAPAIPEKIPPQPVLATEVYTTSPPLARDVPAFPAPQSPDPGRASIRIFTPRPGSIASGGPTQLCYAVNDAVRARVEPGIGDVSPASTLTCIRVTPMRTTTYELDAYGRDGQPVRQQLVIVVK